MKIAPSVVAVTLLVTSVSLIPSTTAEVIFTDSFDANLSGEPEDDINFEVESGRQSGGTQTSRYEEHFNGGNAFLENEEHLGSGALAFKTNYTSEAATSVAVVLNTNFGPQLTGQKYRISFRGLIFKEAGAGGERSDVWLGFILSEGKAIWANGLTTDYCLLLRAGKPMVEWTDGESTPQKNTSGVVEGEPFTVDVEVDETGPSPTAQATINRGTGKEVVGPKFEFTYENDAAGPRFISFRGLQTNAPGGEEGAAANFSVDDLKIQLLD